MITQTQLYSEAMNLYSENGTKFTMDELAARLFISKKTLYEMVRSKEELIIEVIEFYFSAVAAIQDSIHANPLLSNIEKLKKLLCATPDFPIRKYQILELKMNYPSAFKVLDDRLRLGWERTCSVIDHAKTEGAIREMDNQLFSKIYTAAIEEIIMGNEIDNQLTFKQKQEQIVEMLLFGICK